MNDDIIYDWYSIGYMYSCISTGTFGSGDTEMGITGKLTEAAKLEMRRTIQDVVAQNQNKRFEDISISLIAITHMMKGTKDEFYI